MKHRQQMGEEHDLKKPVYTRLSLPPVFAVRETQRGNIIQQLLVPGNSIAGIEEAYETNRVKGILFSPQEESIPPILIMSNRAKPPSEFDYVLRRAQRSNIQTYFEYRWVRHPGFAKVSHVPTDYEQQIQYVLDSWKDSFSYLEEDIKSGIQGLRSPQIGAIHAVHSHWVLTNSAATIVMPTGTGKTETMLSILVSKRCSRLLVVVPTDALRTQLADKFLSLGVLKQFGVVAQTARFPIVGILKHKPKSVDEVDDFLGKCNVVVTTAQIAGQCADDVQERIAQICPFLFIDEAHHAIAPTWEKFRSRFESQTILQFTATPFRNDGKPIGGKIIFNYPLRRALEEEYFKPIRFEPVIEFDRKRADEVIAQKAVTQLREDLKQHDHVLMARVASIARANEVYAIYEKYSDLKPVQLHTGITSTHEKERVRRMVLNREARIVVCVDMLGEGFDLPELKVAAFHDVRKSLPVTLQLAGRFTRTKPNLGEPTFIANIGDVEVRDELRRLYTQDADWNGLLMRSSEEIIGEQVALWEFLEGFRNFPADIPLQNVRPAMSTVIYKTHCEEWSPENFKDGIPALDSLERIHSDVNHQENTLIIVTARKVAIDWLPAEDIFNWDWELYVLHWDSAQGLLFINSSSNVGYYQRLAEAVAGDVELIKGPPVFRCFASVNRLKLQNVGLVEQLGRLIRYVMRAGVDVEAGLTEAQKQNAVKSNIFGNGYEDGKRTSIGCSYKGRVWSRRVANVEALTRWCRYVGHKVLDENIDPDEVLKGTLTPVPVAGRPLKMPISIEWPEVIYQASETCYDFLFGDDLTVPLYAADLRLCNPSEKGDIALEVYSDSLSARFLLTIFANNGVIDYRFLPGPGWTAQIRRGAYQMPLEEFFYKNPPVIWFVDGSSLEGHLLTELKRKYAPYPVERIRAWDWSGVNLKKESQGNTKETDSIQYRVIQELRKQSYSIIFDDDGSGEAADVVAILAETKSVLVDFLHCKFSSEDKPGARIEDLYEVCGQAQKCVHWMEDPTKLFQHLLRRESLRQSGRPSRFEEGDQAELLKITEMTRLLPVTMRVHIVQPGLSKQKVSLAQLELLSVTENYLMETFKVPFFAIASA